MGPGSNYDSIRSAGLKSLKEDAALKESRNPNRQDASNKTPFMACGTVVDTNDPQQMGRLRVAVPAYGDSEQALVSSLPWAQYVSAFGGSSGGGSRGIAHDESAVTQGQVAYGFWAIPKVGATVLVACLEGDPEQRVWLGCIFGQSLNSTMPHGRFSHSEALGGGGGGGGGGGRRSESSDGTTASNITPLPVGNTSTAPNTNPRSSGDSLLSGESGISESQASGALLAEPLRSTNVPDTPENQPLIAKLRAAELANETKRLRGHTANSALARPDGPVTSNQALAADQANKAKQPGGATSRDAAIVGAAGGGKVKKLHDIPDNSIVETTGDYSLEEKAAALDAVAALEEEAGVTTSLQNLPGRGPELTIVPRSPSEVAADASATVVDDPPRAREGGPAGNRSVRASEGVEVPSRCADIEARAFDARLEAARVKFVEGPGERKTLVAELKAQLLTEDARRCNEGDPEPAPTENFEVVGPLSSSGKPIEPLHTNITTAFTKTESIDQTAPLNAPRSNFEVITRGVDHTVSAVPRQLAGTADTPVVQQPDDRGVSFTEPDGRTVKSTQGYRTSRIEPDLAFPDSTGNNNDSQVYAITTPGFHSISMDDSLENNRLKLRTCCGHQIIMDDTNERIYINTAGGNNWIEIDSSGRIDIFSTKGVSISGKDINITAAESFRVHAKNIHFFGAEDIRLHSPGDINMRCGANIYQTAVGSIELKSTLDLVLDTAAIMHLKAVGNILQQGADIHLNGPEPRSAVLAKQAYFTSRVPEHEPWARTMMDMKADRDGLGEGDNGKPNEHKPELTYIDKLVGRTERTEIIPRNANWHR